MTVSHLFSGVLSMVKVRKEIPVVHSSSLFLYWRLSTSPRIRSSDSAYASEVIRDTERVSAEKQIETELVEVSHG